MWKFNDDEMSALAAVRLEGIADDNATRLRRRFSKACEKYTDEELNGLTMHGVKISLNWGITTQRAIFKFTCLLFFCGSNIENHPAIRRILADESQTPEERVDILWFTLRSESDQA